MMPDEGGTLHPELRATLLAALDERDAKVDRDRIAACYDFAAQAHGGQVRQSGEPHMAHAVAVALLLVELLDTRADTPILCAAVMHDVVEDTDVTEADVEKRFGHEVATLVEGVTKLSGMHLEHREAAQAENFRKMLLSMSRDLRVIFIKLADRLHNMRTIHFLRPEKQQRIALETREIYAPLAHRLGMARIKRELEDLSLKVLDSAAFDDLTRRIQAKQEEREAFLSRVQARLEEGLKAAGIKAEVSGRPKHFYSIYNKMKSGRELEAIYDLFGLRIITHTRNDCYRALGVAHDRFTPVAERFKDYIATPKSNLYQSLHTTVSADEGRLVEIQIRTREMHRTAETGVAAHYVYKQGGGPVDEELDAKLGHFVAQTADWQRNATDDEYMDFLRTALYQEEVFVYTPRRELKRLPKGATALDFAFAVHTKVGERTVGARVNGELVTLRYELRNGDTVEIITSPQAQPHEGWLQILRTAGAKNKVRHWLRSRRQADSEHLGREMLERELKRHRVEPTDAQVNEVALGLGLTDSEQLYARLGEGQLSLTSVARKFLPEKEGLAERLTKAPLEALGLTKRATGGVRIQGLDNVMLSFARCCQPVPGDPVIGIVTLGRGVSIHRQDCPNAFAGNIAPERRLPVEWDAKQGESFPVRLVVYGQDRQSLLADLAKAITSAQVNIRSAGIASEDKTARGVFVVEVSHLSKLQSLIVAMRAVPGVSRVERRHRFSTGPSSPRPDEGKS